MASTGTRSTNASSASNASANASSNVNTNVSTGATLDESLFTQLISEVSFSQERRDETLQALKEDVGGLLDKSLEVDAWKFAAPRSQLHLLSGTGIPSSRWIQSMRQELMESMKFYQSDAWNV
ncbi:hypothetical protein SUGI_0849600 [Cryptomeria japonica]|nr:hypothetical protein SUGI_0849600 [Cryptomeria japonica]